MNPAAIFLMGPTASGKTACALQLALHFPIEIISVDSALVYRDMNIGTAKPSASELSACPHHLIDIISPEQAYSAAQFRTDALRLMREIHSRGRISVLVGGTMLYFKALIDGLSDLPKADLEIRARIETQAKTEGWPAVHAKLGRLDPAAANRLNPNDAQRIQRALEIVLITGQPLADSYARKATPEDFKAAYLPLALAPSDRKILHKRIACRFDTMLAENFEAEVRFLRQHYNLTPDMTSMRCVGYRQMWDYLDGKSDLPTLRETGIAATRQLAKRQITWLRQFRENWPGLQEFDCLDMAHPLQIEECIKTWLDIHV
jgi:tRNA dimethylallyltransferase